VTDDPTQSLGGASERTRSTAPAAGVPRAFPAAPIPARIGRYTIVRVLGEGGMGTVYEAEQDQPKRAVALKVIRAGYLSPQLLKRFEHESAVLGRLQHPGIAQVYEAGTVQDERGQPVPFFAMEFIRGVPLTEYAATKSLGTRERLDLVARICDAVYHAHQKGVIHRDLKPGNILVDESGQPKILDFGVARATDSDIQQTTLHTDIGQLIGTVPYMSPEQVGGDPDDLDTRSDVYALGVIAYELLAGRLPHDLQRKMIHEAARIIREEEPTRLSSIHRALRGDVETIVAKALEKDKVRRYQSAGDLAADIERYLNHQPIDARPATAGYLLRRFARRNRVLVGGALATMAALLLGLAGTAWKAVEAQRARVRAEDNATLANSRLAETSAREARLARQRGQWMQVIAAADEAERIGLSEPWPIRLLRLEAIANLNPADVDAELERLAPLQGVQAHLAALELWRAEPRFSKSGDMDAIADRSRHALELGLSGADSLYAQAILAPTITAAIDCLEKALVADPFHSRANRLLITFYQTSGRLADAEHRVRAWLLTEPENVTATAMLVSGLSITNCDEAERLLPTLEGRIDAPILRRLKESVASFRTLGSAGETIMTLEPWRAGEFQSVMAASLTGFASAYSGQDAQDGAGVMTGQGATPVSRRLVLLQLKAVGSTLLGGGRADPEITKEMYRLCPGPNFTLQHAIALARSGRYKEASDTLISRDNVAWLPWVGRLPHHWALYAALGWWGQEDNPEQRAEARRRAVDAARRIAGAGPSDPVFAANLAVAGVELDEPWLLDIAISDLSTFEPSSPIDYKRAAAFQAIQGGHGPTLFLAEYGVRHRPDDPFLVKLRDDSLAGLRKEMRKNKSMSTLAPILAALGHGAPDTKKKNVLAPTQTEGPPDPRIQPPSDGPVEPR